MGKRERERERGKRVKDKIVIPYEELKKEFRKALIYMYGYYKLLKERKLLTRR